MKISTHHDLASRSKLMASATALLAVTCMMGATVGIANAKRLPATTPAPPSVSSPTVTTATLTSVIAPSSFQVTNNTPDGFQIRVSPSTQLGDAELLSGSTVGGPAIVLPFINGGVSFIRLVENSDYVFRYRNKIYNSSSQSFTTSAWVQFSFHTPTFDSLRPAAPQNLREVARTSTTVTLRWDAVPTAARYDVALNNGNPVQTGVCGSPYCTPSDPLTVTVQRPASGSLQFSVTATRSVPYCGPYCFPDTRFATSFPATLVVPN